MSTPAAPIASPSLFASITHDLTWLRTHVLLLAVVGILVVGSVWGVESLLASRTHEIFLQAQAQVQQVVQQNQQLQQQTKVQIDSLTQANVALQQQVGALATAIANRDTQLRQTQNKVPQLTPDQLSAEWMTRVKIGTVKPSSDGYTVDTPAAVATVQALESVPVLEQDKTDLQASNDKLNLQLVNEVSKYDLEVKAHGSDTTACTANLGLKDKELKDVKAQARKSKLKWFGIGVVVGFIGRGFAGF